MFTKIKILLISLILFCCTSNATLISYDFLQGGYTGGATISGMITVDDLDFDGIVGGFPGPPEVVSLMGGFSGNGLVPAFSFDELDLSGFIWFPLLGPVVGDDPTPPVEGIALITFSGFGYSSGLGPTGGFGGIVTAPTGATDSTSLVLILTPKAVPEPSTFAIFTLSFILLVLRRFKCIHKVKNI